MAEKLTQFDYLLNAFELASQADEPAREGYAGKRQALYEYVRALEATQLTPEEAEYLCEAQFSLPGSEAEFQVAKSAARKITAAKERAALSVHEAKSTG